MSPVESSSLILFTMAFTVSVGSSESLRMKCFLERRFWLRSPSKYSENDEFLFLLWYMLKSTWRCPFRSTLVTDGRLLVMFNKSWSSKLTVTWGTGVSQQTALAILTWLSHVLNCTPWIVSHKLEIVPQMKCCNCANWATKTYVRTQKKYATEHMSKTYNLKVSISLLISSNVLIEHNLFV